MMAYLLINVDGVDNRILMKYVRGKVRALMKYQDCSTAYSLSCYLLLDHRFVRLRLNIIRNMKTEFALVTLKQNLSSMK